MNVTDGQRLHPGLAEIPTGVQMWLTDGRVYLWDPGNAVVVDVCPHDGMRFHNLPVALNHLRQAVRRRSC